MLDGHILDEMKHKAPFARTIFMRQFLFARVDDEKWPIFIWQLYLLKSWRVNFYVANENCHIQLPHKIARVDGILLIFTHINSKKGFRLTFRIAELRIIIWIRRTRLSMMLNTVCIKTQHQWTVFQSISNNMFLWQEHWTAEYNATIVM